MSDPYDSDHTDESMAQWITELREGLEGEEMSDNGHTDIEKLRRHPAYKLGLQEAADAWYPDDMEEVVDAHQAIIRSGMTDLNVVEELIRVFSHERLEIIVDMLEDHIGHMQQVEFAKSRRRREIEAEREANVKGLHIVMPEGEREFGDHSREIDRG